MILEICLAILFLIAFIVFSIKGYKNTSYWYEFVGLNSLIAGTNALKEILPTFNSTINIIRITVGLFVIIIFFYRDFKYKKTSNE